jgi:dienelactone hydrolase
VNARVVWVVLPTLVAILAAPHRVASADPPPPGCDTGSWVAGTTNLCGGAVVYRDYVYDDYGANTGLLASSTSIGGSVTPTGDQRYPSGAEDTADLRQLRLAVQDGRLQVTFTLNALYAAGSTTGVVAIDTDADASTGGGRWPSAHVASTGWDVAGVFNAATPGVTVDATANTITGSMPLPVGPHWRVQAVTAQTDGTVMNVAFRGASAESGPWFENRQAADLQAGDISEFGYPVAVGDLTSGVTRLESVPPGVHERVYESAYTVGSGEGMTYQGVPATPNGPPLGPTYHFLGRYQPYAVYVPPTAGSHGLQLVLHGFGGSIDDLLSQAGFRQQFGDNLNRILVAPLGRGPVGWYVGASERDVMDAFDDAEASYPVDRSHEIISGYSMGGYGVYRIAELYPDRFAGFLDWVGYTDCLNGTPLAGVCPIFAGDNPLDYVANLRWVPGGMLYAGADEIVLVTTAAAVQQAFAATGYVYQWWLHPVAEHDTFALLDNWQKEATYSAPFALVSNPPRVTYRYDPAENAPQFGLVHDRAYWVSDVQPAQPGFADVDLTTQGCGGSLPVTAGNSGAGLDPVPWTSTGAAVTGATPLPTARRMTGTLGNVAALTVDADATCLAGGPVSYDITTGGSAALHLSDGRIIQLVGAGEHAGTS